MNAKANRVEVMLTAPIFRTLLRLTLPTTAAMLATSLAAIAETVYIGRLGVEPLAAMALAFPVVMLMQMMSAGAIGGSVSSAISRAIGAGDMERAHSLAWHALTIASLASVGFMVFFWTLGPTIYHLLGGRGGTLAQAVLYSNTLFSGTLAIWWFNILASILRGTGNMLTPSLLTIFVALSQVLLGATLSLGLGPVPRLGMFGLALAQIGVFSAGTLALLWYLRSGRARLRLRLHGVRLQRALFVDILRVGAIACLSPLQTVFTVLIFTALVARFGTHALAGYGIGARLEFLLVPIAFSIGVASLPMVGMAVGAGNIARARRVTWIAAAMAAMTLGSIGLVVILWSDLWAGIFTSDETVLASARSYLVMAGGGFGFFGAGLCLYFSSQGAGHIAGPVLAGTLRLATVALGGWWLLTIDAPAWTLFALAGIAMVLHGVATAGFVYFTPWSKR